MQLQGRPGSAKARSPGSAASQPQTPAGGPSTSKGVTPSTSRGECEVFSYGFLSFLSAVLLYKLQPINFFYVISMNTEGFLSAFVLIFFI